MKLTKAQANVITDTLRSIELPDPPLGDAFPAKTREGFVDNENKSDWSLDAQVAVEACQQDTPSKADNERVCRLVESWMDTAAQNQRNADYYRGLVEKIGDMFGEEARTADDGGLHDSVLCAKVPELVKRDRDWRKATPPWRFPDKGLVGGKQLLVEGDTPQIEEPAPLTGWPVWPVGRGRSGPDWLVAAASGEDARCQVAMHTPDLPGELYNWPSVEGVTAGRSGVLTTFERPRLKRPDSSVADEVFPRKSFERPVEDKPPYTEEELRTAGRTSGKELREALALLDVLAIDPASQARVVEFRREHGL